MCVGVRFPLVMLTFVLYLQYRLLLETAMDCIAQGSHPVPSTGYSSRLLITPCALGLLSDRAIQAPSTSLCLALPTDSPKSTKTVRRDEDLAAFRAPFSPAHLILRQLPPRQRNVACKAPPLFFLTPGGVRIYSGVFSCTSTLESGLRTSNRCNH